MPTLSTEAGRPHPLLIFLHLPKTAGSTLAHILERQYGPSRILTLTNSSFGEELATIPQSKLEPIRVVTGHMYFGVHNFVSRPSSYFTILRNPVHRVISHYHYVLNDPDHYLHSLAKKSSLTEYVIACNLCEPNNDQTRLLAGKDLLPIDGICTPDMLPAAIENLSGQFAVVGLTEEFDRSLILMKWIFGWRNPYYIRQNVSRRRARKENLSPETLEVIQNYNRLDIKLYNYASQHLQDLLSKQGADFARDVFVFQFLNRLYGRWHTCASVADRKRQIRNVLSIKSARTGGS